jgi:glucose/mannose transport system substrate-binding protein
MMFSRRAGVAVLGVAALLGVVACGSGGSGGRTRKVEVVTWRTDQGQKPALDAMTGTFTRQCQGETLVGTMATGGPERDANGALASRLRKGQAPDSFQSATGAQLAEYVTANQVEDLSADLKSWGMESTVPKTLLDSVTVRGKLYAVPVGVHRVNVLWSNKKVLSGAGITSDPNTLDEFIVDLETLKDSGIAAPLALGGDWTQLMLFEAVLITDLGPDRFAGLWTGRTSFAGGDVGTAINDFTRLLSYSNQNRDALGWTDAEKLVTDGKAGYQLMGDWEAADLDARGFKDYGHLTFPGNTTTFQWLADSFVLPKGAKNTAGGTCWLKTIAGTRGQKAFNADKGSIPARTDAVPTGYSAYQQTALADWKKGSAQVPSCATGTACSQGMQNALNAALARFSADQDAPTLQQALVAAAAQFVKG